MNEEYINKVFKGWIGDEEVIQEEVEKKFKELEGGN